MKIAFFTDTFLPKVDGITISINNVINRLSKKHEFKVFAPDYGKEKQSREFSSKAEIVRIPSISLPTYGEVKIALPSMRKLLYAIKDFKPDVIHIHTPGPIGIAGVDCARRLRIKSVGTYHTLVSQQTMYTSPVRLLKLDKLIDKFKDLFVEKKDIEHLLNTDKKHVNRTLKEGFGKKLVWNFSRRIYERCSQIIVPSAAIKRELRKRGFKRKINVVSNGIDISLFKPKKKYKAKKIKLIHVGRMGFEKNIDVIIRSLSIVKDKIPGITLSVVGNGPALESIKDLTSKLDLKKRVKFYGWVKHNKLGRLYRKHDIFLTASTMETQGLVVLEAMASGLPVIAVRKYALPDLVSGKNGFVAKPFNEKEIAGYIEKLASSQGLRERLGKNSVKIAGTHDIKECINLLEKTYSKL